MRKLLYVAIMAATACGAAEPDRLTIDFKTATGPMRPLHGADTGPKRIWDGRGGEQYEYAEAGIPCMRAHEPIGPWGGTHYLDVSNIFPDFDADETRPENYDFTFSDRFLRGFVKANVEIVYRLGETIENDFRIKRYTTHPPKDFAKWARVCEHIVRHYNEGWAGGYRWNIRHWEIWNEPENPQCWSGTPEQYFDLYETTAKHLKRCFPDLMVGGYGACGFYALNHPERSKEEGENAGYFKDLLAFFNDFLARCRDRSIPLDFFTYHTYTIDGYGPWEFALHANYVRSRLDACGFSRTEIYDDEWNVLRFEEFGSLDSVAETPSKESHESASYVAAVLAILQNATRVDKAMFYEGQPHSSFGTLFHTNGKPAEAYETMWAFSRLYRLGTAVKTASSAVSNVFAVAARDAADANRRVLVSNYDFATRRVRLSGLGSGTWDVMRVDEFHRKFMPTGEIVRDGDVLELPWKGLALLEWRGKGEPVRVMLEEREELGPATVGASAVFNGYAAIGRLEPVDDLGVATDGSVVYCIADPTPARLAGIPSGKRALLAKKAKLTVFGCAPDRVPADWPTPVACLDGEIMTRVFAGRLAAESDPSGHNPVRDVYARCLMPRRDCNRFTRDRAEGAPAAGALAVMVAAEGAQARYWDAEEKDGKTVIRQNWHYQCLDYSRTLDRLIARPFAENLRIAWR